MANEKKDPKKDDGVDIDFGMGKIGLGGLFSGIEKLVDLAAKLKEAGGGIQQEGEIDLSHLKKGMKGVFGFSVKSAGGGKPIVEPFGNIKKTPQGPKVDEEREPITDVFDETGEIRVYAEMPGVAPEDIRLDVKEDIL
ncbi:MAG: Hsp20/alpha crystallin family protein, partial [Candidatus Omnitrophota bacterium]